MSISILQIEEGADVNFVFGSAYSCKEGYTPLMAAAHRGRYECCKALLRSGADPNFCNHADDIVLFWGIDGGAFSHPNASNPHFCLAIVHAHMCMYTHTHIQEGERPNAMCVCVYSPLTNSSHDDGCPPTNTQIRIQSVCAGVEIIKLLYEYGADLDYKTSKDWTPLSYAKVRCV